MLPILGGCLIAEGKSAVWSPQTAAERLLHWLEYYVEFTSFDDRTLIIARLGNEAESAEASSGPAEREKLSGGAAENAAPSGGAYQQGGVEHAGKES